MPAWFNERPFAFVTDKLLDWWKKNSPEPFPTQFGSITAPPWNNWGIFYPHQFPDMQPGKLWWPTGASRFGVYYGVADQDTVEAWRDETEGDVEAEVSRTGGTFVMTDRTNETIQRTMYMLPPRPISFYLPGEGKSPLWLVTLVDVRYWWWQYNSGDLLAYPETSWDGLFQLFKDTLEISDEEWSYTTPDDKYLQPGSLIAQASHYPLPVLMDAAAWSIGCRIVIDFDTELTTGVISVMGIDESKTNREAGIKNKQALAGGRYDMRSTFGANTWRDAGCILPEKVTVSFSRVDPATGEEVGRTAYSKDTATTDGFEGYSLFGEVVIHDTAETTSEDPDDSDLIYLADQLAFDYLSYEAESNVNVTFVGLRYLDPCGLYDAVEYNEYMYDDVQNIPDPENGYILQDTIERCMSYTKVTRHPYLWRSFTLHHYIDPNSSGGSGGSGGSGSTPDNTIDCGDGTKKRFTIRRNSNGTYTVTLENI